MKIPSSILILSFLLPTVSLMGSETWTNRENQTMTAELKGVDGDKVTFSREGRIFRYPIENLSDADQARVREWTAKNPTPSPVNTSEATPTGAALKGHLTRLEGRAYTEVQPNSLDNKKVFAFYYSAGWCGPCRKFTPDLVAFYDKIKTKHPEFELVFVSSDRDQGEMENYMRTYKMSFPAIKYDRRHLSVVKKHAESGIPNLVFVDGNGAALSKSYRNGKYAGPRAVLADIERHLATGKL